MHFCLFFLAVVVFLVCAPCVEAGVGPGDYVWIRRFGNSRCAYNAVPDFNHTVAYGVCHDPYANQTTGTIAAGIHVYDYNATDNTIRINYYCLSGRACDPRWCSKRRIVAFDACAPGQYSSDFHLWISPAVAPPGAVVPVAPRTGSAAAPTFALTGLTTLALALDAGWC